MRHIIGFGNQLHGDDGFASEVCRQLQALPIAKDVRIFDAGTRGLDALALLNDCKEAILVDAHAPRWPNPSPGRIIEISINDIILPVDLSGHSGGIACLIEALRLIDPTPPKLRLFTAEASAIHAFSPILSPQMQKAAEQVVAKIWKEIVPND